MISFFLGVILFFIAVCLALTFWPLTLIIVWGAVCYLLLLMLLAIAVGMGFTGTFPFVICGVLALCAFLYVPYRMFTNKD